MSNPSDTTTRIRNGRQASPAPKPAAPFTLMDHQRPVVDFMVNNRFAGVWLDIGGGKTLSVLSALQRIRPVGHILVIAPVAIARSTWINEIEEYGFPIRTRSLIVNDSDRTLSAAKRLERIGEVFTDPPTMYFINQDLVSRPPSPRCATCHGKGGTAPRACTDCQFGLVDQMPVQDMPGPDGKLHPTITWPFPTVIIDESQEFKGHNSNRFRALQKVRPAITRLIELSGTPSPSGLHDLWSQVWLLDQGAALGRNITAFRERWFTPKMSPGTPVPTGWLPKPDAETEIHQAISHLVISARNTSLTMPEVTVEDVPVRLAPHVMDAYKAFKRDLVIEIVNEAAHRQAAEVCHQWILTSDDPEAVDIRGQLTGLSGDELAEALEHLGSCASGASGSPLLDRFAQVPDQAMVSTVVAENQAVLTSKLAQFASGTLYTADPDAPSTKGRYEVLHDEKIQMASHLIRNNGGSPVLVAYHFKSDKEQLLTQLARQGFGIEAFDGSRDMVRRWNASQIPVMLIHPASAGAGLNLQHGGHTLIWFTVPFSLMHYQQTNGRLHRTGQTRPVVIHRLLTRGTQDDRMPTVLATKKLTQDRLLEAVDVDAKLLAALQDEIRDDLNDLWASTRL